MCEHGAPLASQVAAQPSGPGPRVIDFNDLLQAARFLATQPEVRRQHFGFIGYGGVKEGDRILLAVDTQYDPGVVEAFERAFREKGARVDVLVQDLEPDRPFDETDEIRAIMRKEPSRDNRRRYEGEVWIEELALSRGYDLLVHG